MIHATSCLSPRGAPAPPARLFLPPARASRAAHDLAPLSRFRSRLTSATLHTRLLRPILRARSGDGEYLAATLSTHVVKVYRRGEGGALGALLELTGHGGAVTDVTFPLPHEPWGVLSSSADGTTRLWDCRAPESAREVARYAAPFAKEHATSTLGGGVDHLAAVGAEERSSSSIDARGTDRISGRTRRTSRGYGSSPGDGTGSSPRAWTASCVRSTAPGTLPTSATRRLLTVMTADAAVVDIGAQPPGARGPEAADALWALTGNEDAWFFDAGADQNTLGDLLAHVRDTRGAAQRAAEGVPSAESLFRKTDYLVRCVSDQRAGPCVVAGTQEGALGVFPVTRGVGESAETATLNAPIATMTGGHTDIVRAFEPGAFPVTGAEDSRVCAWGAGGGGGRRRGGAEYERRGEGGTNGGGPSRANRGEAPRTRKALAVLTVGVRDVTARGGPRKKVDESSRASLPSIECRRGPR